MRKEILFFLSLFILNIYSCIKGAENTSNNKVILKKTLLKVDKNIINDEIDFRELKVSEDSLDIALFNLISDNDKYSKNKLLENINILIKKGANPNAIVEYQYSYRKIGSYIPIVKSFYKNKYRTVTTNSTPFLVAVNSSKIFLVENLIKLGADVNSADNNKILPIDIALKNEDAKMVDLLIKSKCNVEKANLSVCKNIHLLEKLVKLGADANKIDINFALSNISTLQKVLNLGLNVNTQKLDYQKIFSNEDILDILLKNGLNNSALGKFPNTNEPLIYGAIEYGDLNTIKKLKNAGIDIFKKKKSANTYVSPIISVIKSEKIYILKYYIENGANVNDYDWTKKTALIFAVNTDNDAIIKILINAGANKEYTGYFHKTPLMHAVQMNKYISAQTLINLGANINFKNIYEESCLTIAIKNRNFPMIKLLYENGVDAKQKYKKMNMLEYAKSVDAQDIIIKYIEEKMNN